MSRIRREYRADAVMRSCAMVLLAVLGLLSGGGEVFAEEASTPTEATPEPTPVPRDGDDHAGDGASLEESGLPPVGEIDPRLVDPAAPVARTTGGVLIGGGTLRPQPSRISPARMLSVPMGSVAAGGLAYSGMVAHTGDAATPALEMAAGFGGGAATSLTVGLVLYAIDRDVLTRRPDEPFDGALVPTLVVGSLVPVGAGAATFFAHEALEGRPENRLEVLGASIAGAALGELLWGGATWAMKTPNAAIPMTLSFVPVSAGAALGARLARGGFGREKALVSAPAVFVVRF